MNYEEFLNTYKKKTVIENSNKVAEFPMVSVCVQTYQHRDFIVQCLDGILMQETTFKYEILLGEDASKDGTREICIEYANKYPDKIRLFLHHRENNIEIGGNPSGRFNFIYNLGFSKGKYIAFCEGDDYWTDPLKLQKQVDFLEQNEDYSICFHKTNTTSVGNPELLVDHAIEDRFNSIQHVDKLTYKDLLINGNFIHTCSVVFRNDIETYPSELSFTSAGDYILFVMLARKGYIHRIDQYMSVYRRGVGVFSTLSILDLKISRLNYLIPMFSLMDAEEDKRLIFNQIQLTQKSILNYKQPEIQYGIKLAIRILLKEILKKIKSA